ncbi:EAL domain-containing protein [Pseudomonas sp. DWP1b1]|uniref:EAL domain-containing protein n=1 Tax=unclassified Pseudomonas TaxID=196821 RepID=UPI003CECFB4A
MSSYTLITPGIGQVLSPAPAIHPDEMELRRALSDSEFVAFYQPQFSLEKNIVVAVEVLARWRHPQRGLLPPGYFLEAIEHYGLLEELFLRLFEQGQIMRRKLECLNLPLKMSYNLHPRQLNNPILIDAIKVLLKAHECPAQSITFEITETSPLELTHVVTRNLLQLRATGCGLSMDDYGAGYSSLERLCDIPFNELKLDASFVRKLETHAPCKSVITHTVTLADSLGLALVIEGVETLTQLNWLKAMGCSMIQGYVIAPPMDDKELLSFLLENLSGSRVVSASF